MRSIFTTVFMLALVGVTAFAQVPRTISFQGRARDAAGLYPDNVKQMTVRIFDAPAGGQELFAETHLVLFTRGAFTVILGEKTPGGLPDNVHFNQPLWLAVSIEGFNGGQELAPRLKFASAPSAMSAERAESAATADVADGLAPGSTIEVSYIEASDTIGTGQAPDPGVMYRDNLPLAWGLVNSEGTIVTDFGIASVQHIGPGQYEIVLDNPGLMIQVPKGRTVPSYAPMVQPSLLSTAGLPLFAQWFFTPGTTDQDRHISVRTFVLQDGLQNAVDVGFSIIVFGRAAN